MYRVAISIFFISAFCSCGGKNPEEDAVARVYDKYLTKAELSQIVPYGLSSKDSLSLIKEYIDEWIKRNLVLRRAELNLTDEQKDVSDQLEDYRSSLITFAYERELVRQKLDTTVSNAEIETYYRENAANFELKSNIIRLKYIKLSLKAPNADKAKVWLLGKSDADRDKLEQYCGMYAVNYLLDDNNWLLFDDVLKEIPLSDYSMDQFNRNKRFLELADKDFRYFVSVTGFIVKESNAPLSFERGNIRNIILNKRKIKLVEQMQLDAYNDALNEKDIEYFTSAKN